MKNELRLSSVTGANKITLPYWDWTSQYYTTNPKDDAINSPLWDNNFMGQFNSLLTLNRNLGSLTWAILPTSSTVGTCLALTQFDPTFWVDLEGNNHNSPHNWVNGTMRSVASPLDPIFFLHHNMVDKIWQNWTDLGNASPFPVDKQDLQGLNTIIKSNDVDDSRKLKVWFAENGKVELNKYTATGVENYDYTGIINVSNNFVVPSGTTANFTSATEIAFLPGTSIEEGSSMSAEINNSIFNVARLEMQEVVEIEPSKNEFNSNVKIYPNPFENFVSIFFSFSENVLITITDVLGKIVYAKTMNVVSNQNIEIETVFFHNGVYFINIQSKSLNITSKIIK